MSIRWFGENKNTRLIMNKRILYIGGFELPDKNAAAHRVMANALLLREIGYEVEFIGITKDRKTAITEINGFKCRYVDYPQNIYQWFKHILTFVSTKKIFASQPDYVILYNFPAIASLKILKKCHKHKIKVISDLTEWEGSRSYSPRELIHLLDINLRMRFCIKKMDGVIAISRFLYNRYEKYTHCILVPPLVDLSNQKWNRDRELTSGDNIKLVYAGDAGLGNKDKLDVIISEVKHFPSIKMKVVGMSQSQYEQGYNLKVDSTNVTFLGYISHTEAIKTVCEADFQLLIRDNTLKCKAGFPTKFVESMSCCTPIIATLTSNIDDYLDDGINGFIVDEKQTLNQVFIRLVSMNKKEIINMKKNCRDFIGFDYHNYKKIFSEFFQ